VIFYVTAWKTGDIGGGLNAAIEPLPDDAWICVRDGDTLFLTPDWGKQVEQVVAENGWRYELMSCVTNRLRAAYQLHEGQISNVADIGHHIDIAHRRWVEFGPMIRPIDRGPVAGMFLLFRKATWKRHPFEPRSIYFDQRFTTMVRAHGGKVGVAWGIYLFHLYRWGQPNPSEYKGHLI
jgi:hypothetical protein